jgi:hypothetical protein
MKAQVALTAAVQAAKDGVKPDRCAELIDVALLNLTEFKNAIRSHDSGFPRFRPRPRTSIASA